MSGRDFPARFSFTANPPHLRHISATSARRKRRNTARRAFLMCSQREADTVRRAFLMCSQKEANAARRTLLMCLQRVANTVRRAFFMCSQKEADTARRALLMRSQKEADTARRALSMCSQKRQTQKAQNTKAAAGHIPVSRRRVFFQFVSSKLICVIRAISSSGMLPSRMTELQCSLFI